MKRKIVTLCGSMRFYEESLGVAEKLELEHGYAVIGFVNHVLPKELTDAEKELLGELHKRKIEISDAIFVLNVGGYIGKTTRDEIEYAKLLGKEILFYESVGYSRTIESDLSFVIEVYNRNIDALHGKVRSVVEWERLVFNGESEYYTVFNDEVPVAWFRCEIEDGMLWLGMLQVVPIYHRRGIGKYIISVVEGMAKSRGIRKTGIHTTEDNCAARSLYESMGYRVVEIGECTNADGETRVGYTFEKEV